MPIPTPGKDESKESFISRCMGNTVMNNEFPDRKQRFAVCNTRWEKKDSKASEEEIEVNTENISPVLRNEGKNS